MLVVINCYLDSAEKRGSWGSAPKTLVDMIMAIEPEVTVSGFDPVFQCQIFDLMHTLNRSPNSMANVMRLAQASIRWVRTFGRRYDLRVLSGQAVMSNVVEICKHLNVPLPEPRNEHPGMADMARMLKAAASDEPLRRWFLLTHYPDERSRV